MKSSKTHGAKPGPACGRALAGELLIDTNTAGSLSRDGFATSRPVNGLIFDEKSSGPKNWGRLCGCGVDVEDGVWVEVAVKGMSVEIITVGVG